MKHQDHEKFDITANVKVKPKRKSVFIQKAFEVLDQ